MSKFNQRLWPFLDGAAVILLGLVLVTGCEVSLIRGEWTKPGGTEEQWRKDAYVCEREARLTYPMKPPERPDASRRSASLHAATRGGRGRWEAYCDRNTDRPAAGYRPA